MNFIRILQQRKFLNLVKIYDSITEKMRAKGFIRQWPITDEVNVSIRESFKADLYDQSSIKRLCTSSKSFRTSNKHQTV